MPLDKPLCNIVARAVEPLGTCTNRIECLKRATTIGREKDCENRITYLGQSKVKLGAVLVFEEPFDFLCVLLGRKTIKTVLDEIAEGDISIKALRELYRNQ